MESSSRYAELTCSFDRAATRAFEAIDTQAFIGQVPELSQPLLFMVYGAYIQASRQACANAKAEFRVLAKANELDSKLMKLETIEMEQGLDNFGGSAEGTSQSPVIVPEDVARHCRMASKRSEHSMLADELQKVELQLASKKLETEQLMIRAEEATSGYLKAESRIQLDTDPR